jgi:deoxyinosine 3'endonuclease (endonuclease V)
MIFAFDVAYNENNIAQAVGIGFEKWTDERPKVIHKEFIIGLESYTPGEFYKRELPCIEKILGKLDLGTIDTMIIDGYVYLDNGRPGLGAHLFNKLDQKIPIIGIAKTAFENNSIYIREIKRGQSTKPLYISAAGILLDDAAVLIQKMDGNYRIPTLLSKLDQLTKR